MKYLLYSTVIFNNKQNKQITYMGIIFGMSWLWMILIRGQTDQLVQAG